MVQIPWKWNKVERYVFKVDIFSLPLGRIDITISGSPQEQQPSEMLLTEGTCINVLFSLRMCFYEASCSPHGVYMWRTKTSPGACSHPPEATVYMLKHQRSWVTNRSLNTGQVPTRGKFTTWYGAGWKRLEKSECTELRRKGPSRMLRDHSEE